MLYTCLAGYRVDCSAVSRVVPDVQVLIKWFQPRSLAANFSPRNKVSPQNWALGRNVKRSLSWVQDQDITSLKIIYKSFTQLRGCIKSVCQSYLWGSLGLTVNLKTYFNLSIVFSQYQRGIFLELLGNWPICYNHLQTKDGQGQIRKGDCVEMQMGGITWY